MRYNSTCCYHTLPAYMHARKNDDTGTYPTIIAYDDWFLWFGSLLVDGDIQTSELMARSHHHHIRSHHHIISNSDITIEASVASQLASVTNRETRTITEITMVLYYHVFATTTQQMPCTPISQLVA